MGLDSRLISGLYADDVIPVQDRLRLLLATNHRFAEVSREIIAFVVSHNDKYAKLPDLTTLKEKYPLFEMEKLPEPYIYYLEEAIRWKKVLHMQAAIHDTERLLGSGEIDKAATHYSLTAREFEFLDLRSADIPIKEKIDQTLADYKTIRDSGGATGLYTGFATIDKVTNGISPGDFWVIASRPKNYKTFTVCKIFQHMAMNYEGTFLFFSKEMTKEQIQKRLLAIIGNLNYHLFRTYQLSDDAIDSLKERLAQFVGNMIIVGRDSREDYDVSFVRSKLMEYEPKMAVIDGAYLFSKSSEWQDQTAATRMLREIALATNVPILATTQLNKKKEVGYSDSYEQDATVLITQNRVVDAVTDVPTNKVKLTLLRVREAEDNVSSLFSIDFTNMRFVEGDVDAGVADTMSVDMLEATDVL